MAGANLIVFRNTKEIASGRDLAGKLVSVMRKVSPHDVPSIMNGLLLAGEVECALCDSGQDSTLSSGVTNTLAALFVGAACADQSSLHARAGEVAAALPDTLRINHPEGFAYYALHPGDFADAVANMDTGGTVAVAGIRSVGTTLSAVATAELNKKGSRVGRITVRPGGHPYNRTLELEPEQIRWLREQDRLAARFLIVDEGPGLSGSSFLATAEGLLKYGIGADRITMLGTREIDPAQLCSNNASSRWKRFGWSRVSSRISTRFRDAIPLCGGAWRDLFISPDAGRPAFWPEMDAVKFWSADRRQVFKFEGLGEAGSRMRNRAAAIYEAGFGLRTQDAGDGMSSYQFLPGSPLATFDMAAEVLDRIAQYCAFRASQFRCERPADDQLEEMLRFNFLQECGRKSVLPEETLRTVSPVITDNRMQPHKWIASNTGRLVKVDGSRHGDDHFFPGPTDIAWDLAGAVIEWDLDDSGQQYLLSRFRAHSGIDSAPILPAFLLAYSTFRCSYCKMALLGTNVASEKPALERAYLFYRRKLDAAARLVQTAAA